MMEERAHNLRHRRVTPAEFRRLLSRSGFTVRDYMALTGRRFLAVDGFLNQGKQDYIPLPAEVLLLELAIANRQAIVPLMISINNDYLENAAPRVAPVVVERKRRF